MFAGCVCERLLIDSKLFILLYLTAHNAVAQKSDHYQNLLATTRDKSAKDKDALKKATRIQRERAQRQEELNTELQGQISDLLFQVMIIRTGVGSLRSEI